MLLNIDAIYDHGVFRPVEPLVLPDGARVHLRVEEESGNTLETSNNASDYKAWLDGLAGRWEGAFVRGDEGEFEKRETLS